ncbi:MAG: efflux RND transporter periplasmic adaptor subunit [Deltaproteobacteria bacterium]|nr:efflux RND transporter periplasmic adaptor subunit [Deltaproteobacteria bacterium]
MKEREVISVTRIMIVTMPLLLVAAFVSCSRQAEDDDAPAPVRPAKIIEIQDPSAALERVFPGVVVPTDSTMLAFRVGGWLESLPVVDRVGAMVEAGDLLAALDPTDFQNSLDSAEASFQLAEQQYKRALKLLKEDVMSETEHDRLRARYRSKEAELKQAQTNLSYTRLHAPFRGRVARVIVRNYETVRAEEPIAVLEDAEKIDVEIQVPTAVMARISPGVKATFRAGKSEVQVYEIEFESEPGERYPASISESETQPDPATLTYRTIVSMPTPEGLEVLAGTNAKVHVDLGELGDFNARIYLPVEAVFSPGDAPVEEGVAYVWRVDPGSMAIRRQRVSVGPILPYGIQIKEGLAPGDRIVGSGVHFLTDGTVVRELVREPGL